MAVKTISSFLKNSTSRWPDKTAVIKGSSKLSFKNISDQSDLLSKVLTSNGIKKDDRVCIFLEKSPEEIFSIFAVNKINSIFVSLSPKLKKDQIFHIINDCQIKAIITRKGMYDLVLKDGLRETSVKVIVFAEEGKYVSKEIISKKDIFNPPPAENVACIIYTSGSTGRPKGVVIPNKNLIDGADIVSQYLHCKHVDKALSLLPFSFDYGLNQLLTTFKNGATIVLHNFIFPEDVLKIIGKEKITALAGIPTIWISLMNSPSINNHDFSSLRYVTNSGGKIPVEYVKKMIKVFKNKKIYLMYGLTEAFRSTYLPPELVRRKPDSIGKSIPRVRISVLSKAGKECKPEEPGELVHRGALISLGYWGNRQATDERIRKLPEGASNRKHGEMGVFSGDLVKKDKEGFLYYLGRNDEMIKSSGYRISPTEIEEVLYKINGLTAAVVFGKEDPNLGQKIVAVVSHKDNSAHGKKKILAHCVNHLPDYAVPHEIIFLTDMPKTSSGKLDRSLIKAKYDEYQKD